MKSFPSILIESKVRKYPVYFTQDFNFLNKFNSKNCVFAIDEKIFHLYEDYLFRNFSQDSLIILKSQEKTKGLSKAIELYQILMKNKVKRTLKLISIGGGVTQDLTGFVASTLYRGINWVYIPTTLLAQADSCIGSKTSLNLDGYKNILGTFYPPSEIYINTSFIETLGELEFLSGLGEIIKFQLMSIKQEELPEVVKKIEIIKKTKSQTRILKIIKESLRIKKLYIEEDEFDYGKRNLLNYGHTFGHALEATSSYHIPHGIAVLIGIIFANSISLKRKLLNQVFFEDVNKQLLIPIIKSITLKNIYFNDQKLIENIQNDKKRETENFTFILLNHRMKLIKVDNITQEEFKITLSFIKRKLSSNLIK